MTHSKILSHNEPCIMIIDDDPQTHEVTTFALRDTHFLGHNLTFIHAFSAREAKDLMKQHDNIALMIIDVTMEEPLSGHHLVEYIRDELKNHNVQLILRTGQSIPTLSKEMVENYKVHAYKEKTSFTKSQLTDTVLSALHIFYQTGNK